VHPDAERVHGISTASLKNKPVFKLVAADFLEFIGDTPLVIHNAPFDIGFINMELDRLRLKPIDTVRVIDTLPMARRKHPAGPNSLDALCKRYNIDTRNRTKHGAIVDSLLLAQVYLELLGERQSSLGFGGSKDAASGKLNATGAKRTAKAKQRPDVLPSRLSADDDARHAEFVKTLGAHAAWLKTTS
jgi:DNA polymerase III subunit epsilon